MVEGVNARQVGGDHYKCGYEHWDLVLRTGMGYLAGNATKYLARYERAGKRKQDLQKAAHYVQKMLETTFIPPHDRPPKVWLMHEVGLFCAANGITGVRLAALVLLAVWETEADLRTALKLINDMLGAPSVVRETDHALLRQEAMARGAGAVPAEDSNKHADRELRSKG